MDGPGPTGYPPRALVALRGAARRAIRRDDLLHLAYDAERALGILNRRDRGFHPTVERNLLRQALDRLRQADNETAEWTSRCRYRRQRAAITGFAEWFGKPEPDEYSTEQLFADAHRLAGGGPPDAWNTGSSDLVEELDIGWRRGRQLRIRAEQAQAADQPHRYAQLERLLNRHRRDFLGSGGEDCYAEYLFQRIATLIEQGRAAEASDVDTEAAAFWRESAAEVEASRHRLHHAMGLALLAEGRTVEAVARLDEARDVLRIDVMRHDLNRLSQVQLLSLLLSTVSARLALIAELPSSPDTVAAAAEDVRAVASGLLAEAVGLLAGLRVRWRVVSRSRSPLSDAFRRIYGEIALLAARLGTPEAARLGLVVATTAKQTGYAALLRQQRNLLTDSVRELVDQIVQTEFDLDHAAQTSEAIKKAEQALDLLRKRLLDAVSPLLADLVLPHDRTLAQLLHVLNGRCALDYLKIADVYGDIHWFRSLAESSGAVTFERFELGSECERFLYQDDGGEPLSANMAYLTADDPIWTSLAAELLPRRLRRLLERRDDTIELVISPHDELGYLPWAALHIDDQRRPLITAAMLTQTPMLECLTGRPSVRPSGHALICLTGPAEDRPGLDITAELAAWNFELPCDQPPVARQSIAPAEGERPVPAAGSLPETLADAELARTFALAHLAGHGSGTGLGQQVQLPTGWLSAGHALGLTWPGSVILRACHVGKLTDLQEVEPYGMVMALLAGGARTVIAGLLQISDTGTADLTVGVVARLATGARPEHALHEEQLRLQRNGDNVYRWGLLGAYVI